jgi:hypothetical protein
MQSRAEDGKVMESLPQPSCLQTPAAEGWTLIYSLLFFFSLLLSGKPHPNHLLNSLSTHCLWEPSWIFNCSDDSEWTQIWTLTENCSFHFCAKYTLGLLLCICMFKSLFLSVGSSVSFSYHLPPLHPVKKGICHYRDYCHSRMYPWSCPGRNGSFWILHNDTYTGRWPWKTITTCYQWVSQHPYLSQVGVIYCHLFWDLWSA